MKDRLSAPLTTSRLRPGSFHVDSPADHLIDELVGLRGKEQLRIARAILRLDPGCCRARLIMAKYAKSLTERINHLDLAVQAGEMIWAPVAQACPGLDWYERVETRNYLRAIAQLGSAYAEAGDTVRAHACFTRCLEINPKDDMEVRDELNRLDVPQGYAPRI